MKKHLVKVLSIVMALTMVLGVFGPYAVFAQNTTTTNQDDVECNHVWGDVVVDDISCDEDGNIVSGRIYRECTVEGCDEIDELLELTPQNISNILGVGCQQHGAYVYAIAEGDEPTCTEDGKLTLTCPVCGDGYGTGAYEIPVKKLGHIGENNTAWNNAWVEETAATCTTAGLKVRDCARCGHHEEESIKALNHNLTDTDDTGAFVTINPAAGCGCAADTSKVPADTPIVKEGTCYQKGWIYQHCTLCHAVRKIDNPKSNHPWVELASGTNGYDNTKIAYEVVTGTATCPGTQDACECTRATLYFKVCSICGIREENTELRKEAKGHKWESKVWNGANAESSFCSTPGWEKVVDSNKKTCDPTSVNYYIRECTVCGCEENVNYFIDAHQNTKYICDTHTDNCTNCLDAGRKLVCAVCRAENKEAVYTAHDLKKGALVTAATCTAPAVYKFECDNENCTYFENQNVGDPNPENHPAAYGTNGEKGLQVYEHIEPNCKEDGKTKAFCNDCFTAIDKTLPKNPNNHGENYVTTKTPQAASCMAEGWTLGGYCTLCGHEDVSELLVKDFSEAGHAAAGCTPVDSINVEATCVHPAFKATLWSKCERDSKTTIGTTKDHTKHYSVTIKWVAGTNNAKVAQRTETQITPTDVAIVDPTCIADGNHAYSYCPGCDTIISINYTSCVAKGCTLENKSNANDHEAAFKKYIGTDRNTNGNKLTITKLGHDFTTIQNPFLAETCNVPGNQAEIYCTRTCCQNVEDGANMGANTLVKDGQVYLVKSSYTVVDGERVTGMIAQDGATIAPHGFGHVWENTTNVKAATCTENGVAAGKFCELCPISTAADRCCNGYTDVIKATGHKLVSNSFTVGNATVSVVRCENLVCNSDLEANPSAIYLKNNSTLATGSAAAYTDTHGAHIWYGQNYTVNSTATTPSTPNTCEHPETSVSKDNVNSYDPTCVNDGLTIMVCNDCGEVVSATVVPATGHRNADGNFIYLDCQSYEIYAGQTCANPDCGLTAGTDIQHNLVLVENDATCEKAENAATGERYYQCEDCDIKVDVTTAEAATDDFIDGTYEFDEETDIEVINMYTARYVSTVEYVPATSTSAGSWTWNCVCGEAHTQELLYSYSLEFDVEVAPYTYNEDKTTAVYANGSLIEVLVYVTAKDVAVSAFDFRLDYSWNVLDFVSAEIIYDTDPETEGVQNDFEQPNIGNNAKVNGSDIALVTTAKTGVDSVVITGEKVPMFKYVFRIGERVNAIATTDITVNTTNTEFVTDADATVTVNQITEAITADDFKLMGDLNDDGEVSVKDLVEFRKISNANGYNVLADFNNDGAVDFLDLIALNNFVASAKTVKDYYVMLNGSITELLAAHAEDKDYDTSGIVDLYDLRILSDNVAAYMSFDHGATDLLTTVSSENMNLSFLLAYVDNLYGVNP